MAEKKVVRYQLERHKWPDEIEAEKKAKKKKIELILLCIFCFVSGFMVNKHFGKAKVFQDKKFVKLSEVYDIMSNQFYFGKDKENFNEQLINGAISGMVDAGGDIHTAYMNKDDSESFTSSMEGSVVGIGVTMYSLDDSAFIISDILKNSPAEKAGVLPGDQIAAVDGKKVTGKKIDDVIELVTGKSGTEVSIEFVRGKEHFTKKIIRKKVYGTVFSDIKDQTAKIELRTFAETSGEEFGVHLKDIEKAGVKNIIIDLRGNSGGYLNAALEIASYFIDDHEVIFQEDDHEGNVKQYKALEGFKKYKFNKIVVLVDQGTASASEALTGALKERADAIVVGERTYGKGTVQIPLPFNDGSMLKYTIGEWMTPDGHKINKVGIEPDVKVAQEKAFITPMPKLNEQVFKPDTVNPAASSVQIYLDFLGYPVDRSDEYFSFTSSKALQQFQTDHGLIADGNIRAEVCKSLVSEMIQRQKNESYTYDLQLKKAMEIATKN